MNSFKNKKVKKSKKKHDKKSKKGKKRRRHSSSSDSSSSSSSESTSSSSSDEKHKKRKRKHKKKKDEKHKKIKIQEKPKESDYNEADDFGIPIDLMDNSRGRPETKEEYEKRQNVIRRVVDEETGRSRLIKGDGEILEEIVSRDRHMQINKNATKTDASNFEKKSIGNAMKK